MICAVASEMLFEAQSLKVWLVLVIDFLLLKNKRVRINDKRMVK